MQMCIAFVESLDNIWSLKLLFQMIQKHIKFLLIYILIHVLVLIFLDKNHIQKTFLSGKTLYCDI